MCRWSFGHTERGEKKRGEGARGDLVLGQVWFPLDQRPGVGLFVQAERPKGEQRQPDVCSSQPDCHRGSISCSASLSRPSCPHPLLCIPPFHPPLWNKVQKGLLNCLRMFSVYVLFMRVVSEPLALPSLKLSHVMDMSFICEPSPVY